MGGPAVIQRLALRRAGSLGDRTLRALDVGAAVLFAAAALVSAALSMHGRGAQLTWGGAVIVGGCWLPLAWRRVEPLNAAAVSLGCLAAGVAAAIPVPNIVAAHAVIYLLAATRRRRLAAGAAVATVAVVSLAEAWRGWQLFGLSVAGAAVVAMAWGEAVRARRDRATSLVDRAVRAETEAATAARRAVAEERLHIARELHDLVAHTMSVIAVQAGSGRVAAAVDPQAATRALAAIEDASREVLVEMRRLLGVLRSDDESTERHPVPVLAEVGDLVTRSCTAGVQATLTVTGQPRPLPKALELSAYRVAQEALTNVARHAAGSRASVRIDYGAGELQIEVRNGAAPNAKRSAEGSGHGLAGMRERAAMFGGQVQAGPSGDGGFRVLARFPIPRDAGSPSMQSVRAQ